MASALRPLRPGSTPITRPIGTAISMSSSTVGSRNSATPPAMASSIESTPPGALVVLVEDDLAQSLDRGGVDGADGLGDPAFDRLVRGVAERPLGGLGLGHHDGIV